MPREIQLTRNKGWFGRLRSLKIYADETLVGELKAGETKTLSIPDDAKELFGKMDWAKTNKFPLESVKNNHHLYVYAWFTFNFLRLFGIIAMPIKIQDHEK